MFLKKRNKKVTNQSPDFADEALNSDNEKTTGFSKIFGARGSTSGGGVSTYNGLEHQVNMKSASYGAGAAAANAGNDFEYRGVTNSNNLDSVFRSTASNTAHNSTGQNSATDTPRQGHSRYNSVIVPTMGTMHEGDAQETEGGEKYVSEETPYPAHEDLRSTLMGSEKSSDYATDEEFLFHEAPHQFWTEANHSNNSRSRFTEDIA